MKKIAIRIFLSLLSLSTALQAEFDPFVRTDAGFLKYHILEAHLEDASGNKDSIKNTKTHIAPLFRFSLGFEYNDLAMLRSNNRTTGRIGLSVQYAKKSNGVVGHYYDKGFTSPAFSIMQDIKRVDGLLFLEYDFAHWYGYNFTLGGAVGIATGVLKDLKMYELDNNAFIGQSLKPHTLSPNGYLGFAIRKTFEAVPSLHYQLGYNLGVAGVRYKPLVIQSQPDANAGLFAQNAFNLLNDLSLVKAPHFTVFSNQLAFAVEWSF